MFNFGSQEWNSIAMYRPLPGLICKWCFLGACREVLDVVAVWSSGISIPAESVFPACCNNFRPGSVGIFDLNQCAKPFHFSPVDPLTGAHWEGLALQEHLEECKHRTWSGWSQGPDPTWGRADYSSSIWLVGGMYGQFTNFQIAWCFLQATKCK